MVRTYPAYKHDDIFNLSVTEVYTLKLMAMDMNAIESEKGKVRQQEANQKRKK